MRLVPMSSTACVTSSTFVRAAFASSRAAGKIPARSLVVALAVAVMRSLFAALMVSGFFSLLSAGMFLLLDAVDVAFTEAAVGAGIATILGMGTLVLTKTDTAKPGPISPWPILIVVLTGGVLIYGTLDMPRYGDPQAPVHQHVAPRYIRDSAEEVGVPNMVTAVLASYRG